jgi:DNA-binding IclR family transcriptional regulator
MPRTTKSAKPKAKGRSDGSLPRHGNRSIVRAVSLLRVIAAFGRPAALGEIAAGAGMSAPRAHRYLLGLARTNLVEQSPISGRYDLGPEIVELGVAALGRVDAVRLASEALGPLAEQTGLSALITVWGTNGPTVVRCEQSPLTSAIRVREGRNLPLLQSASGRVFLAYLPDVLVAPFLAGEFKADGRGAARLRAANRKRVDKARAEVRRHGIARGISGVLPNVAVLAAPVFNAGGSLALCMAVISSVGGFDTGYGGKPATALKRAAAEVSRRLGYSRG